MKSTGVVDSRAPLTRIGREHTFPLLGREWECERVERLLQTIGALGTPKASSTPVSATAAGVVDPPQSVLLTGEAGIGKTRLAEEWGTQAMRLGWYVFWSSGRPMLSGNPYQIWMEILRQALHLQITYPPEVYRALTLLEEGQDEAHGGPRGGDTQPPRRLGEQAHLRLWEAFCALLAHLAEHAPVLVILDDVGYSDSLSRDLFRYLTRQVRGRAIMLVGTMRSHEGQGKRDPWHLLTRDLLRERALLMLAVEPLSDGSIEQLTLLLKEDLSEEQRERIRVQSGGNPFFCEELVRHLGEDEEKKDPTGALPLPPSITASLEQRVSRVGVTCRRLLSEAAVLGGGFDFQTVSAMESSSSLAHEEEFEQALEEALAEGIVIENERMGAPASYQFWHPLLVSHLYARLAPRDRVTLHRRAAEALCEDGGGEERAALITYHLQYGEASSHLILQYALLAAQRAYRLLAYPEAERYYRLVLERVDAPLPTPPLERWQIFGQSSVDDAQGALRARETLWELLGECAMVQGHYHEAERCYAQAQACLSDPALPGCLPMARLAEHQALLCRERGLTYRYRGDAQRAWACYHEGVQYLSEAGVVGGPAWACMHYQAGSLHWQEGRYDQALQASWQALQLFEQQRGGTNEHPDELTQYSAPLPLPRTRRTLLGDPVDSGRAHLLRGTLLGLCGQAREGGMHLETALAIFEGEGCEREAMIVCDNLGDALLRQARYPEAEAYLQRALQSAERMGDGPSLSVSLANLGILALRRGRLAEGERLLTQACLVAERVQDSVYVSLWSSYLALLLHAQGKCGEAQGSIRRAFSAGRKVPSCLGAALVQLGWMRLTQVTFGHLEALRLQANSTWSACHCARCNKLLVGTERSIRRVLPLAGIEAETRVEALLILASVLVLRECRDEARQYLRLAQEEAQQGELAWLVAHATRVEAQLEMLAGHFEQANQCFAQAHGLFHRYEMHLEEARTLSLHGTALCLGSPNDGPSLAQLRRGASYLREAARLAENCQAPLDQHRIAWLLGHLSSSHEPSQARS